MFRPRVRSISNLGALMVVPSTSRKRPQNLECPISIKWIVSEEKLAALKDSTTYGYLATEWFNASSIPGVKYSLAIYPNGNTEAYRDNVMVYLYLEFENETKIKADVKFSVESAGFTKKENFEYEKSWGWGFSICETKEFFDPTKKFIVDGKFTLKCEGIIYVEREKSAGNENGIKFDDGHIGHKLWLEDDKDFTINVGGSRIKVHKNVLAAQSPVFKNMLKCGMKETTENQMDIIDFPHKIVQTAVQLLYSIQSSMDMNDKMGVLQFCDKYDIGDLKESFTLTTTFFIAVSFQSRIEDSLIEDVSISNVCQIANCSILSNALKLEEKCAQLLIESLKNGTPLIDIYLIDKDFLLKVVKNANCTISET